MCPPPRLRADVTIDGIVCRLPGRRVHVGLPGTLAIWLALAGVLTGVLSVPASVWPDGTRMLVGGLVAVLTVAGALPLWMFMNAEMMGQRARILRATHLGVDVVDGRFAKVGVLSPHAGRTPGYVFARWSGVQEVQSNEAMIGLILEQSSVQIPVDGLTRVELQWVVERLRELASVVPSAGDVPPTLTRLAVEAR